MKRIIQAIKDYFNKTKHNQKNDHSSALENIPDKLDTKAKEPKTPLTK